MSPFSNLSDSSQNAPRLRVGHTLWGMSGLPMNAATEWTLDEKFSRIAGAGFGHVECWVFEDEKTREVRDLLEKHGLIMAFGHRPSTVDDTRVVIERAAKFGGREVEKHRQNAKNAKILLILAF